MEVVEQRYVALAMITRPGPNSTEYLLVQNPSHGGYMFPVKRITEDLGPKAATKKIFTHDFGYRDEVHPVPGAVTSLLQGSDRYGRPALFHFHLVPVTLAADVDLHLPFGPLEKALYGKGLKWKWLTADELKTPGPIQVAPTLSQLVDDVLQEVPSQPSPACDHSHGAIALAERIVQGEKRWLARWNQKWKACFFVGGHIEPGETPREALLREIQEELGLSGNEVVISAQPAHQLHYQAVSQRTKKLAHYDMSLFALTFPPTSEGRLAQIDRVRWLTKEEILNHATTIGPEVSPTVASQLYQIGAIS